MTIPVVVFLLALGVAASLGYIVCLFVHIEHIPLQPGHASRLDRADGVGTTSQPRRVEVAVLPGSFPNHNDQN